MLKRRLACARENLWRAQLTGVGGRDGARPPGRPLPGALGSFLARRAVPLAVTPPTSCNPSSKPTDFI